MASHPPITTSSPRRGIVFFAHGSRDPLWSLPIEAVAEKLQQQNPTALCQCAYLELTTPDLATATADLVDKGCEFITVLPMFLGTGRHARQDLPQLVQELQASYPGIGFEIATAVGEDPRLTALLAQMAQQYIE